MRSPSQDELKRIAKSNYFSLSDEELLVYSETINSALTSFEKLDDLIGRVQRPNYIRDPGHFPPREENTFGAWAWKCSIKESDDGPLAGKKIAIKDNISVAGIPLVNGSPMLRNFLPNEDASIVRRILHAGGEIDGKARCENLCASCGSHTSYPEPVRNPLDPQFMAGGSSSGSAALIVSGEVDMAIGADQAGSIRIPSSWCGVYGLKPTFGLVPYTGAMSLELTLDHVGPMAGTVHDVALLLEAIAGRDSFDPRQLNCPLKIPRYTENLVVDLKDLKIGVVKEGFDWSSLSEPDVDGTVLDASKKFASLGAQVQEISIPEHRDGIHIWTGMNVEGAWSTVVRDNGLEHSGNGHYNTLLAETWSLSRRADSDKLPPRTKINALLGNYLAENFHGRYYTIAQNLRNYLRERYDNAFKKYDLLLMPTTLQKAQRFPGDNLKEYVTVGRINIYNTRPFNVTGHPAMNVPCGKSDGLPIGMMLIGKHFDESTVLGAAFAYEQNFAGSI